MRSSGSGRPIVGRETSLPERAASGESRAVKGLLFQPSQPPGPGGTDSPWVPSSRETVTEWRGRGQVVTAEGAKAKPAPASLSASPGPASAAEDKMVCVSWLFALRNPSRKTCQHLALAAQPPRPLELGCRLVRLWLHLQPVGGWPVPGLELHRLTAINAKEALSPSALLSSTGWGPRLCH